MSRTVFCRRLQQDLEGLERPPFPGPKGEDIFNNISKQAWEEWQATQTRLINEKHLNMRDMESRKYIQEQMDKYLAGEDTDEAEGYVPPEK